MSKMGELYVVATPIGNLADITLRAITVLTDVGLIAAEDTRQSRKLLTHYGIHTPIISVHAHNERERAAYLIEKLKTPIDIAYITDAGTPLISDPGAFLVKAVREQGIRVIPIPGANAAITALSVSGFMEPHFFFEGFLPHRQTARQHRLQALKSLTATLVFYESPHRITQTLSDINAVLGNRDAVIARELTKRYETITTGNVQALHALVMEKASSRLGEFVVLVAGNKETSSLPTEKITTTLRILLAELPVKSAVSVASQLLNIGKNELYAEALKLKG